MAVWTTSAETPVNQVRALLDSLTLRELPQQEMPDASPGNVNEIAQVELRRRKLSAAMIMLNQLNEVRKRTPRLPGSQVTQGEMIFARKGRRNAMALMTRLQPVQQDAVETKDSVCISHERAEVDAQLPERGQALSTISAAPQSCILDDPAYVDLRQTRAQTGDQRVLNDVLQPVLDAIHQHLCLVQPGIRFYRQLALRILDGRFEDPAEKDVPAIRLQEWLHDDGSVVDTRKELIAWIERLGRTAEQLEAGEFSKYAAWLRAIIPAMPSDYDDTSRVSVNLKAIRQRIQDVFEDAASVSNDATSSDSQFVFRKEGTGYYVEGFGENGYVSDSKGFRSLFMLVQSPGVSVRMDDLVADGNDLGEHVRQWSAAMTTARGVQGVRVLQGLKALAAKHPSTELDAACETALAHGAYRLRTIRQLLKQQAASQQKQFEFLAEHPVIRPLSDYSLDSLTAFRKDRPHESDSG